MTKEQIKALATKTRDAYSFDTYGEREWIRAIRLLADRGYNERGIEGILRSKLTRRAADSKDRAYGKARGEDVLNYLDNPMNKVSDATITRLAQETFNDDGTDIGRPTHPKAQTGADLAGACEGEDIADLIDFARTTRDETAPSGDAGDAERQLAILRDKAARILARIEARAK